ncbi:uridine kinase [bacterium]|nr:MAG: uridine kinase [bacterium]
MKQKQILIGIAGGTASGKTSVSTEILNAFGGQNQVVIIAQDSYYKDLAHIPFEKRLNFNFDHPDAFDNDLLIEQLKMAVNRQSVEIPTYDHKTHSRRQETLLIEPHKVILLEGILILENQKLRDLMDIKVYIDTDADVRLIRRLKRDIKERARTLDSVLEQYERFVMPMHLQFVEPSKRYADIIIPHGVENKVGVDILMTKIKALLDAHHET